MPVKKAHVLILIETTAQENCFPVTQHANFRVRKSPAWFDRHQRVPSPLEYLQRHWHTLIHMEYLIGAMERTPSYY